MRRISNVIEAPQVICRGVMVTRSHPIACAEFTSQQSSLLERWHLELADSSEVVRQIGTWVISSHPASKCSQIPEIIFKSYLLQGKWRHSKIRMYLNLEDMISLQNCTGPSWILFCYDIECHQMKITFTMGKNESGHSRSHRI